MYQPKKNHAFILLAFLSVCFVNFIGCKKTNNFATKLPMAPVLQKEEKPKLNWELYPNHPAKKIYEDLALETDDAFQVFLFFLLSKDLSMPDQDSFFQILNVDRKNENWEQKIKEKVEVLQQAVKTRKFLIRRKKVPFLFATSEKLAKLVLGSVPFNDFSDSGQEVFEKIPTKNLQKSTIVGY
jgi:Fe-S cluster biosynthesis and repair protein YggX